jgi:hypothetical protein
MQGRTGLGLELLTALAEEGDALDRRRRTALVPLLVRRSPEVFGLLSQILSGQLTAGKDPVSMRSCVQLQAPYRSQTYSMQICRYVTRTCANGDMNGAGLQVDKHPTFRF